jgi:hypothetical protein
MVYIAGSTDQEVIEELQEEISALNTLLLAEGVAKKQSQDRERVLRDTFLKFMDNSFCSNFKTLYQRSTVCNPPDEGQCDNYDACRELDKALNQEANNG